MPASSAASNTRRASASSEFTPFMNPLVSPKVIAPRLSALTRRPLLPNCRCSIVSSITATGCGTGLWPWWVYLLAGALMPEALEEVPSAADQAALAVEQRLAEVVQGFDEALRGRVTLLLLLASEAIVKLADLDLVRSEADEEQGGHTLALWEELAPVMGTTVQHVNDLIDGVTAQFPTPADPGGDGDLEATLGPGWAKPDGA